MSCVLADLGPAVQRILSSQRSTTTSYDTPAPLCLWEYHLLFGSILNSFVSWWTQSTGPKYVLFESNGPNWIFFDFKCWSLEAMCLTVSLQTSSPYPYLPDMTCSVSYNLRHHNVIKRCLSAMSFFVSAIMATITPGLMPKWDLKRCMLRLSRTLSLLAPKPTISSPNDITDLTFVAMSLLLQFNLILLKTVAMQRFSIIK